MPDGVLPRELDATLTDVRVSVNAKTKGGPPGDDAIYAENAEIRAKVMARPSQLVLQGVCF